MNYLDIIIVVPLVYGLIKGFSNGLIKEVTALVALLAGVYVAINFSLYLEPKVADVLGGYEQFIFIIAFAILFFVSVLCVKAIGFMLEKLTKALALGIISRFLGGFFGLLKVMVIFSFLLFVITDYNLVNKKTKDDSVLYKPLSDIAAIITPQLKKSQLILDKINEISLLLLLSMEEMQQIAESRGGKCLSTKYVNAKTPLIWQCIEGHTWEAQPDNVKNQKVPLCLSFLVKRSSDPESRGEASVSCTDQVRHTIKCNSTLLLDSRFRGNDKFFK